MIYRNYETGYKNGIEHFLYLSDVTDNDIALLTCLGYEHYGAFTIDGCEVETWVKYESKDLKTKLIKALLQTITYDEMTKEQEKLEELSNTIISVIIHICLQRRKWNYGKADRERRIRSY